MKTNRSCSVDLMSTKINTLCIRLSLTIDKNGQHERKHMVLFERDLEQFIPAFLKVMNAYKKRKSEAVLVKLPSVQQSIEFPL